MRTDGNKQSWLKPFALPRNQNEGATSRARLVEAVSCATHKLSETWPRRPSLRAQSQEREFPNERRPGRGQQIDLAGGSGRSWDLDHHHRLTLEAGPGGASCEALGRPFFT